MTLLPPAETADPRKKPNQSTQWATTFILPNLGSGWTTVAETRYRRPLAKGHPFPVSNTREGIFVPRSTHSE